MVWALAATETISYGMLYYSVAAFRCRCADWASYVGKR